MNYLLFYCRIWVLFSCPSTFMLLRLGKSSHEPWLILRSRELSSLLLSLPDPLHSSVVFDLSWSEGFLSFGSFECSVGAFSSPFSLRMRTSFIFQRLRLGYSAVSAQFLSRGLWLTKPCKLYLMGLIQFSLQSFTSVEETPLQQRVFESNPMLFLKTHWPFFHLPSSHPWFTYLCA